MILRLFIAVTIMVLIFIPVHRLLKRYYRKVNKSLELEDMGYENVDVSEWVHKKHKEADEILKEADDVKKKAISAAEKCLKDLKENK